MNKKPSKKNVEKLKQYFLKHDAESNSKPDEKPRPKPQAAKNGLLR